MDTMFEQELQYFIDNQEDLVRRFNGKTLVIRQQTVVGVYDTPFEAYLDATAKYEPGSFMIQKCQPGEDAYTATLSPALAIVV